VSENANENVKSPCREPSNMREQILRLAQTPAELFVHRFTRCCHATACNRLCERLVKGPGAAAVQCWTNYPDSPAAMEHLYAALERREFICPIGRF
jgi:hypothetical protein